MTLENGQILQLIITIVGSGLAAYLAVTAKIHRVENMISKLRLDFVTECETKREKIYEKITKVKNDIHQKSIRDHTNPGIPVIDSDRV